MKVYTRNMTENSFEDTEVFQELGIVIEHKGRRYSISESNQNEELILRSLDGVQLILKCKSSNSVEIESE